MGKLAHAFKRFFATGTWEAQVDNVAEEVQVPGGQDITGLLLDWGSGNREALDKLTPLVYNELRALAARQLRGRVVA